MDDIPLEKMTRIQLCEFRQKIADDQEQCYNLYLENLIVVVRLKFDLIGEPPEIRDQLLKQYEEWSQELCEWKKKLTILLEKVDCIIKKRYPKSYWIKEGF